MTDTLFPGFLPHLRFEVDAVIQEVGEQAQRVASLEENRYSPPVSALGILLSSNPILSMYAQEMLEQVPSQYRSVTTIPQLLASLELLSTRAPVFNSDPKRANFFPASALFVHMQMTSAGQSLFRLKSFNDCLRNILKSWCQHLDSRQSRNVLHKGEDGWLSAPSWERHNLHEYFVSGDPLSFGGFNSFNAFFHRQINRKFRPVADPDNPRTIVSPNDGTLYKVEHNVRSTDRFWIKSQPYALEHMLAGDPLSRKFVGGTVFQSFLDGSNYHRFWSPISGTVRKIVKIEGLMFSNAESVGFDLTAGTYSQAYMTCVNTRCFVIIESENPAIGMVCLMAIGISEVSSITISVQLGQSLVKGDELGYFSYGGSSICLLFQPGVIRNFAIDISNTGTEVGVRGLPLKVGQHIACAS